VQERERERKEDPCVCTKKLEGRLKAEG